MNEPAFSSQALPADRASQSRGTRLRAAREAAGLSQEDVATRLRLSVRQVQAIEQDEEDALPSGPFFRGFVRNYARTVGRDPAEFDDQPLAVARPEPAPGPAVGGALVALAPPQPQHKMLLESGRASANRRWLAAAVVTLVLGALGSWLRMEHLRTAGDLIASKAEPGIAQISGMLNSVNGKPRAAHELPAPAAPAAAVPAASADQPAAPVTTAGQSSLLLQASTSVPTLATPASDANAPAAAAISANAAASAGSRKLELDFDADSWVEVRDENNQVLLSGLSRAGDHRDVEAHGPVRIVVGNAPGTRVSWNGRPVDLAEFTRFTVARLTLDPAQGNP